MFVCTSIIPILPNYRLWGETKAILHTKFINIHKRVFNSHINRIGSNFIFTYLFSVKANVNCAAFHWQQWLNRIDSICKHFRHSNLIKKWFWSQNLYFLWNSPRQWFDKQVCFESFVWNAYAEAIGNWCCLFFGFLCVIFYLPHIRFTLAVELIIVIAYALCAMLRRTLNAYIESFRQFGKTSYNHYVLTFLHSKFILAFDFATPIWFDICIFLLI